tara:strand:- start:5617 stop:5829 length:213 start_codon:yes stop_codon:yes gene_type:complete
MDESLKDHRTLTGPPCEVISMSLRDYFAGKAMKFMLDSMDEPEYGYIEIAYECYHFADAMLKAKEDTEDV